MNKHEIAEVRRTWNLASARMPLFGQLFCIRMRLIDTRRRILFGDDAESNARLLLRLVGIAVHGLNQPRILYPLLETLGRQNAQRILNARHNCNVIRALLWALKATLGPSFNGAARHAWVAGYRAVAQAMTAGIVADARDNRHNANAEAPAIVTGKLAGNPMRRSTPPAGSLTPPCPREAFA